MRIPAGPFILSLALLCGARQDLIQVRHDFAGDPGWEGFNNRVAAAAGPALKQDFGWSDASVGGTVASSTTPATYGMKVGPYMLKDRLSASATVRIARAPGRSAVYFGFFNASRQGWRPWSSLMVGLLGSKRGAGLRNAPGEAGQVWFHSQTATWRTDAFVADAAVPADGTPHEIRFDYDPDATVDPAWPAPHLAACFMKPGLIAEETLFETARKQAPALARPELRRQLEAAAFQGLIVYDPRRGTDFWELRDGHEKCRGIVTIRVADRKPERMFLAPGNRDQPAVFDRFGLVNMQTYGRAMEVRFSDLTVNGSKVDLSRDPGWEGKGNRVTFTETDFHPRQDFGYSKPRGEIGGTFWRTEPVDPLHASYADDVGTLTLDDPISFSGTVCFEEGQPDSGMCIGFFNRKEQTAEMIEESSGSPVNQSLGLCIEGPTRIGHYFAPFCSPRREIATRKDGLVFMPTGERRRFTFDYDPRAGSGRITATLDDATLVLDLNPAQRKAGATFDRFGLTNVRIGGKYVRIFFDDLTYTARRPAGHAPARHEDRIVTIPFPDGGRKY